MLIEQILCGANFIQIGPQENVSLTYLKAKKGAISVLASIFRHGFVLQVSVSCGIPDFRSRDGLYARLAVEYPDLPDPQAMFDINYFERNPYPFFKFAKV